MEKAWQVQGTVGKISLCPLNFYITGFFSGWIATPQGCSVVVAHRWTGGWWLVLSLWRELLDQSALAETWVKKINSKVRWFPWNTIVGEAVVHHIHHYKWKFLQMIQVKDVFLLPFFSNKRTMTKRINS